MVTFKRIPLSLLDFNTGQIPGLPANPREWTDHELKRLAKSLKETPELAEARGCIVVPLGSRFVVLGGNLRLAAAKHLKWPDIMCAVIPEDTPVAKLKEIVLKDNSSFGSWDLSMLRADWSDVDFGDWGISVNWDTAGPEPDASVSQTPQEEIERMRREFEERMERGEISEEDEEYQEFLEKFKLKKTTDDCYTPAPVYEAVAKYVEETYGVSREQFVRPFYPGGDYRNERYPEGCVVVDNPPFSIMSEILRFYDSKGIRFFLFAPTLTLFSSSSASTCTALACTLAVIYENGASVNTSFLTNLERGGGQIPLSPEAAGDGPGGHRRVHEDPEEVAPEVFIPAAHHHLVMGGRTVAPGHRVQRAGGRVGRHQWPGLPEGLGQGDLRQGLHRQRQGESRALDAQRARACHH
jgi:hypothetical protein